MDGILRMRPGTGSPGSIFLLNQTEAANQLLLFRADQRFRFVEFFQSFIHLRQQLLCIGTVCVAHHLFHRQLTGTGIVPREIADPGQIPLQNIGCFCVPQKTLQLGIDTK